MSALPSAINYQEGLAVLPENTQNFNIACVPVSGGSFGASSQIQVDLGNRGFLDPASLLIRYKITYVSNDAAATNCQVVGTPAYTPFLRFETLVNSNTVETINNYNSVCNMLTNIQLGISEKYGMQSALGYENYAAAPYSMENLDGGTIDATTVQVINGVNQTAGTFVRYYSAPLIGLLAGSEKLIPLFLLNNIRLQFTCDTLANIQSAKAANALITDFKISNFEVCYNMVDFGNEVEREIIAMNPKVRIKSQSYSTGTQSIGLGANGSINLVYNQRYASVKSAYLNCGGNDATISYNRMFDAYDVTSGNGDYQFQIGSINYPQKSLSTFNNRSGILQELRRSMNTIFGKNVSMSINTLEYSSVSATQTTPVVPAKFWVGVCLQKLTIPQKAFFTGVSTQNSPITVIINIGTATAQIHTAMLILNYDAIIEIDTSTKQCVLIQ
jgi:hypothetical protein